VINATRAASATKGHEPERHPNKTTYPVTNRFRSRIGGLLAAGLVIGLAVPASITVTSATAHAAACDAVPDGTAFGGIPKYEILPGCSNVYVSGAHKCQQVIPGSAAQAVECADVYATNSSSRYIRGVGKFYCQGTYTQCLGMHVSNLLAFTNNGNSGSGGQGFTQGVTYTCNPNPGPACPTGGASRAENLWSGAAYLSDYTPGNVDNNCMTVYSIDPSDGWNGYPNVMAVKGVNVGVHEYIELDSVNVQICFG
jgi:hypothetical protein